MNNTVEDERVYSKENVRIFLYTECVVVIA